MSAVSRRAAANALRTWPGAALLSLLVAGLACELLLRVRPSLLPSSFLRTLPAEGVELFHPGVLARTPIEGVPLPLRRSRYAGPPFSDLERLGMVRPADNPDPRSWPAIRLEVDELGLPNPRSEPRADLVFAGDSYLVYAALLEPPGLVAQVEEASGLSVYNLGVSGIGPTREAWLLAALGLAKRPRAVVWFFFGGNDVQDVAGVLAERRRGIATHADAHATSDRPPSLALALLAHWLRGGPAAAPPREPLPPLWLAAAEGEPTPVWFYPKCLRFLAIDTDQWRGNPGWQTAQQLLRSARDLAGGAGAPLLVVYLPSKPQVYLDRVRASDAELFAMATYEEPLPGFTPARFAREARRSRDSLEGLVADFCRSEGIPFLSATPLLRRLVAAGVAPYYAADSHWNVRGQAALVEPLLAALEGLGVPLPRAARSASGNVTKTSPGRMPEPSLRESP